MPKAGLRTTELLVTILTDVGVVAASAAGWLPPKWAAVAASVAQAAYAISRGLAKFSPLPVAVVPATTPTVPPQ